MRFFFLFCLAAAVVAAGPLEEVVRGAEGVFSLRVSCPRDSLRGRIGSWVAGSWGEVIVLADEGGRDSAVIRWGGQGEFKVASLAWWACGVFTSVVGGRRWMVAPSIRS